MKADVVRIASKTKEQQCTTAEEALQVAMQMKYSVVQARHCSDADLLKALGQMFTRVSMVE